MTECNPQLLVFSSLGRRQVQADFAGGTLTSDASAPTVCRLENGETRASLARMAGVLVEQFIASFEQPPEELILDFDATDEPVHGTQEARFFHS